MNLCKKTIGAAAFALVAITVSSTSVHKSYSSGAPVLIPPMLSDGRLFSAQLAANIPINEFTAQQVAQGIVLPKDSHNFFTCSVGDSISVRANDLDTARTWVYEFTGSEPPFTGKFFISDGELAANSKYDSLDTLQTFSLGKRYYQMGQVDMYFKCNSGLLLIQSCGDGILSGTEKCDDGNTQSNDGCNASCNTELGYACNSAPSQCSMLIPELPGAPVESDQNPPAENEPIITNPPIQNITPDDDISDVENLTISIDGPTNSSLSLAENDANLGNILFTTGGSDVDIRYIFVSVQGKTAENANFGGDGISHIMENVRLKNTQTNAEIIGTRLVQSSDFGTSNNSEPGTYQIYRFNDVEVRGNTTWQFLAHLTDNGPTSHPSNGDTFRIHICGEPTYVPYESTDLQYNTTGCDFGGMMNGSTAYQMFTVRPSDNAVIGNVLPRGDIAGAYQTVKSSDATANHPSAPDESVGALYITQDTSVPTHQITLGVPSTTALRLHLRAEDADIQVFKLCFDVYGDSSSYDDALELYMEGSSTPFSTATSGPNGYCANQLPFNKLIIPQGKTVTVDVRPKIETKALLGKKIRVRVIPNLNPVFAHNAQHINEAPWPKMYIGRATPGPNVQIEGPEHIIVPAKITSITKTFYIPDGSTVPVGRPAIGAYHLESEGANASILSIIFTIDANNVVLSTDGFQLSAVPDLGNFVSQYVLSDTSQIHIDCEPHYLTGEKITSDKISGSFVVECSLLQKNGSLLEVAQSVFSVSPGKSLTLILKGDVLNRNLNPANNSSLQMNFQNFASPDLEYGVTGSHIKLQYVDWIDYPGAIRVSSNVSNTQTTNSTEPESPIKFTSIRTIPTQTLNRYQSSQIGQFTFSTDRSNSNDNGNTSAAFDQIIFDVDMSNLYIDHRYMKIYNVADPSVKVPCTVRKENGSFNHSVLSEQYKYAVHCSGLIASPVNTSVNAGGSIVLALEGRVSGIPDTSTPSELHVSLSHFNNSSTPFGFGVNGSHINWIETHGDDHEMRNWIEYLTPVIRSSSYYRS